MSSAKSRTDQPDLWTIVAIAIIAYALGSVLHEGVGHGGACVLTGGKPLVMSTVHFDCGQDTRIISAAGTIVNLLVGFLCWLLLRLVSGNTSGRYFIWLLMTTNLLQGGGYFLFSGIGNIGDWSDVIRGLNPPWLWRTGLTALGVVSYIAFVGLAVHEMLPFLGDNPLKRHQLARRLTITPYLAGGIFSCVAGAFNPVGLILVAISAAAASFGGTSGLAWMHYLIRSKPSANTAPGALTLSRSYAWIAGAVVVATLFIAILGRGLRFH